MRTALVLLPVTLLVLAATACGQSDAEPAPPTPTAVPELELGVTHTITSWGYSMAYPTGWLTGLGNRATFISELIEDHNNRVWPMFGTPRPITGYQVSLTMTPRVFLDPVTRSPVDIPADLDGLRNWYENNYTLRAPGESTQAQMLGVPALRLAGTLGFGRAAECFIGLTEKFAFLFCLGAPTEQALDEFMPTWERMLATIKPVDE